MKEKALWGGVAALVVLQIAMVTAYLAAEKTVFYWDHAMYIGFARQFFMVSQNGLGALLTALHDSFSLNYSYLFAFPALAGFSLIDASRTTYIFSNFLVWFLLFEGAVAFSLRRGLSFSWPLSLVCSLGFFVLVPIAWIPLLQGYPEAAAAAALMFAFGVLVGPTRKKTEALKLGVALACAVLLRRHFAYGGLALVLTAGIFDLWSLKQAAQNGRRALFLRLCVFYGGAGITALLVLLGVATDFFMNALTINYNELYDSYRKPPVEFLTYTLANFGYLATALSCGGLIALVRLKQKLGLFVGVWCGLWLVLWCGGPIEIGPHYLQQVLVPTFVLGLAGWVVVVKNKPVWRPWFALGVFVLGFNSAWSLALAPSEVRPDPLESPGLLAAAHAPVQRTDLKELIRLADTLENTTSAKDHIVVLGSSVVFNQDLLHTVYTDYLGSYDALPRFVPAPEIDGVQDAPYDLIATPSVFVVPEPVQYHLDPDGQRVQGALAALFPPKDALAAHFVADPDLYILEKGVMVRVWRKKTELTPGLTYNLALSMKQFMNNHKTANASEQRAWLFTNFALVGAATTLAESGATHAQGWFDPNHTSQSLLYNAPLTAGKYQVSSFLMSTPKCTSGFGRWQVLSETGNVLSSGSFAQKNVGPFEQVLEVPAHKGLAFLELTMGASFTPLEIQACWVVANNLALTGLSY